MSRQSRYPSVQVPAGVDGAGTGAAADVLEATADGVLSGDDAEIGAATLGVEGDVGAAVDVLEGDELTRVLSVVGMKLEIEKCDGTTEESGADCEAVLDKGRPEDKLNITETDTETDESEETGVERDKELARGVELGAGEIGKAEETDTEEETGAGAAVACGLPSHVCLINLAVPSGYSTTDPGFGYEIACCACCPSNVVQPSAASPMFAMNMGGRSLRVCSLEALSPTIVIGAQFM